MKKHILNFVLICSWINAVCGNFKKDDMIAAFLNSEDPLLVSSTFWQNLKNKSSLFQNKKGAWVKPIDDLVDSWWVLKTLEKHIAENKKMR
jgi:hypothetical protein